MTEKTGLFRRLEAFEKLMAAANAEATVAVAYLTENESREEFGEAVKALEEESEHRNARRSISHRTGSPFSDSAVAPVHPRIVYIFERGDHNAGWATPFKPGLSLRFKRIFSRQEIKVKTIFEKP